MWPTGPNESNPLVNPGAQQPPTRDSRNAIWSDPRVRELAAAAQALVDATDADRPQGMTLRETRDRIRERVKFALDDIVPAGATWPLTEETADNG